MRNVKPKALQSQSMASPIFGYASSGITVHFGIERFANIFVHLPSGHCTGHAPLSHLASRTMLTIITAPAIKAVARRAYQGPRRKGHVENCSGVRRLAIRGPAQSWGVCERRPR